jgi:hypothetical protein
VEIDAWYALADGPPLALQPFDEEVGYSIVQLDPAAKEIAVPPPKRHCENLALPGVEDRHVPISTDNVVFIKAATWPAATQERLNQGVLELPVGRWRVIVVVRAKFGPCGDPAETWETHATVDFDVVDQLD